MIKIAFVALLLGTGLPLAAQQERVLGIDVSAWQGNIAQANWNTLKNVNGRDFVSVRSSRGGTTGYYNQSDSDNSSGVNTLSQRYDDPYFVQNITRATAAGMLAGPYHFARLDIVENTKNSGGIANNGTDEANHMIEMAGAWMRPGYLLPMFDLEAGINQRNPNEMATFCIDFSDRIYEVMGFRPLMYINGSYAAHVQSSSLAGALVDAYPVLWVARYANQSNPDSIPVQTAHPKDYTSHIYGPWDDAPNPTHPWNFWQYASTARLSGYNNGGSNIDVNVAQGGMEFLKDHAVPAVWMNNSSGQWTTLANWNSGQTPIAPVQGPGQVARVGPMTLPATRLPGLNDTVILDRPNANITVTLASGTHNIRKLYVRETLNLTGGTLNVKYIPSWDSTPFAAQFSGPVTLSGTGFNVHTLQVDAAQTFTISGGTLFINTIRLMPHGTSPAKIAVNGNVTVSANSIYTVNSTITNGVGAGASGFIDLGGATRTFNFLLTSLNLAAEVPITNGGLVKTGPGAMHLNKVNTYSGGTTISAGRLFVNNTSGSGTGSGTVTVNGGTLGGTGRIAGAVTVNSGGTIAPGIASSIATLTLNTAPTLSGTTLMKINRNGGAPLADKISLTSGTLNYGGTLVITNAGAALVGGEVFKIFAANEYAGSFSAVQLPALNNGLNWYLGDLVTDGTIKVNRSPVGGLVTFTNDLATGLNIPFASLVAGTDVDGDPIAFSGLSLVTTNGVALVTNITSAFYFNNINVTDQFNYTVSDGRGGSGTGVARIVPSSNGLFTRFPSLNPGSVTLHLAGEPGSTYYVERSPDLSVWTTISTNVVPGNGLFELTDEFLGGGESPSSAYYRVRW